MNFNENKIYTVSDYINAYAKFRKGGLPYGYKTGIEGLDKLCRLDKGRLAVVTGVPSSGKSTFVNYLCAAYNIKYGFRTLFYSAETNLMLHLNTFYKIFRKQDDERFIQYIADNFMLFNENQSFSTDALLEAIEEQYANTPFDVFVIDNYATLSYSRPNNMTETEYISCVLDKLTRFARKCNVVVILIAHPRKMNKSIEGGGYEEPTPYDICGSVHFFNKADFCLTVHRIWEDKRPTNVTKIIANKVKVSNYGAVGSVYLGFSADFESYGDIAYTPDDKEFVYKGENYTVKIPPLNFEYTVATDERPQYFETQLNCFKNISDTIPHIISFKDLQKMQAKYADSVKQIRAEENEDRQKQMKSELLPCIAFNVRFNGNRCKDNISEYTNLLYIDIDYKDNKPHIMESLPQTLSKIDNILFFQRSARGKGYMAVMPTDDIKGEQDFLAVWKAAEADFKKLGIVIDSNTKDASRVTFISYDEHSYINQYAIPYTRRCTDGKEMKSARQEDKQRTAMSSQTGSAIIRNDKNSTTVEAVVNPNTSSTASNEQTLKAYIDFVNQNKVNFCKDYKDYFDVGIACLKEFGLDKTKEYFPQLCQYSPKYDYETTLADIDKWYAAYDGEYKCNFATVAYHFQQCSNNMNAS